MRESGIRVAPGKDSDPIQSIEDEPSSNDVAQAKYKKKKKDEKTPFSTEVSFRSHSLRNLNTLIKLRLTQNLSYCLKTVHDFCQVLLFAFGISIEKDVKSGLYFPL